MASALMLHVAVGLFLGALGAWVLLAQPAARLNRALAAMLLLFSGSTIAFQLMRDAALVGDAVGALAYVRTGTLYETPTAFLVVFIADQLFLARPRPRWRSAALAFVGASGALGVVMLLSAPSHDILLLPRSDGGLQALAVARLEILWTGLGVFVAEAFAVVLAARAARAPERSTLQRRQAAMVGLAFAMLVAHDAGSALGNVLSSVMVGRAYALNAPPEAAGLAVGLVAMAATVVAVLMLPRTFHGRARVAAALLILLPLAGSAISSGRLVLLAVGAPVAWLDAAGYAIAPRFLWLTAFAVVLAVAILRYDVAGVADEARRRRIRRASNAVLAGGVAGIGAGLGLSVLGTGPEGMGIGLLALASPAALRLPRVRGALHGLSQRLILDAADPEVVREQARVYTEALRVAVRGRDAGDLARDPALVALRGHLGLTERDHLLLLGMTEGDAFRQGRLLTGRYRLLRELGRGGFGEAWLARDEREACDVVVKRLVGEQRRSAAALQRFRKEIRLASALRHPNIVAVHDIQGLGPEAFFVMEFVPGGSLADRLRDVGPLPPAEVARIGLDVCAALGALHARGILHRDVKPGNVLLDGQGGAKLGDFTIAHDIVSGETAGGARGPLGTVAYMAPEQARGQLAGPRSDLYALAATLHEALVGRPPVEVDGLSEFEGAMRVLQAPPALASPALPPIWRRLLRRALAKDPDDRFADAEAMAAALRRAEAGATPVGTRAGSGRPRPRPRA